MIVGRVRSIPPGEHEAESIVIYDSTSNELKMLRGPISTNDKNDVRRIDLIVIDDKFMKELGVTLQPNTSALFVLVKEVTPDKVIDKLKGFGGKVLQTSLSKADEERLQTVLEENNALAPSMADANTSADE